MPHPTGASRAPRCQTGGPASRKVRRATGRSWRRTFLASLAETSNVSASARAAGIAPSTAYEARRSDAEFNRQWQQALCEGYDHLELELLHRLRSGEVKPASGTKRGARQFDNATAFRLLVAHRESAARQRAIRDNEDSEAIILSINAKLDLMRERRLTSPAAETDAGAGDRGAEAADGGQ